MALLGHVKQSYARIAPAKRFQILAALPVLALVMVVGLSLHLSSRAATPPALPGDVNADGAVNVFDLSLLLTKWGTPDAAADINKDGIVNIFDLSILLSNWGKTAPTPTPTPTPPPTSGYYVAPGGNDSSNGSVQAPFATLNHANSVVQPGETVYLRGGVYQTSGPVVLTKSGTAGAPTVFTAYPGETPILDGASSGINWDSILNVQNSHDITVSYIQVRNAPNNSIGISLTNSQRVVVDHVVVHDTQRGGITLDGVDYSIVRNSETYNDNLANSGGTASQYGWSAGTSCGKPSNGHSFNTGNQWLNNYVHNGWGEGLNTDFSDGAVVNGNHISNHYAQKLYSDDSKNGTITNNFIEQPDPTYHRYSGGENGIGMQAETGFQRPINMIINGNTFGAGIYNPPVAVYDASWNTTPVTQSPNTQSWP